MTVWTDGRDGVPGSENHPVADEDRELLAGGSPLDRGQGLTVGFGPGDSRKAPQILGGVRNPDTALGLKGLSLSLHQGPPLLYTTGGASGPRHRGRPRGLPVGRMRGQGKEALECPQLRHLELRHRTGQWHPCTMGLECGTGMGSPMASDQDQTHGNGACLRL